MPVASRAFRALLLLAAAGVFGTAVAQSPRSSDVSPDTVLIKFRPGTPAAERASALAAVGGRVEREIARLGVSVARVPEGAVERVVGALARNPHVLYAEPSFRRSIYLPTTTEGAEPSLGISNNFNEQWGLDNTGQQFGATTDPLSGSIVYPSYTATADADINAPAGWAIEQGSASVRIAILDTGVSCDHLDLAGKCVDEVNFVAARGSDLPDILGHGSHVAGIAAATTDNGVGVAGVGRLSSVVNLKSCWEDQSLALFGIVFGRCEDADVATALMYAIDQGIEVVSMSFAGPSPSMTLREAVADAWNAGIVLVAAAGNDYASTPNYPAAYDQVIAVGSSDYHDNLSGFSSFGDWVQVLAPGSVIVSTVPGGFCGQADGVQSDCYDTKSGTSMSAPHVAGLASLLVAQGRGNAEVRAAIEETADTSGALGQDFAAWVTKGRIDMAAALAYGSGGGEATTAQVDSVTLGTQSAGRGAKYGTATVIILDDLGVPAAGASVTGSFSGDVGGSSSMATDASGRAAFVSATTAKGGLDFSFCVTGIMATPLASELENPQSWCAAQ